jgi:MFS family permease
VVVLEAVMSILDITVVTVAQPTFQHDFDATPAQVAWSMTGYTVALAAVVPLTGWAADRFGTKRLYLLALQYDPTIAERLGPAALVDGLEQAAQAFGGAFVVVAIVLVPAALLPCSRRTASEGEQTVAAAMERPQHAEPRAAGTDSVGEPEAA